MIQNLHVFQKKAVKAHFEELAGQYDFWKSKNEIYYGEIKRFLRSKIEPAKRILDVGCGTGSLLASLEPSLGVGVDLSEGMVQIARQKFPQYRFLVCDCENLPFRENFDFVVMVDLMDHLTDHRAAFSALRQVLSDRSRVVLLTANPKWDPALRWAEKKGWKMPEGPNRFVSTKELMEILRRLGYDVIEKGFRLFVPKRIPVVSGVLNACAPKIPFLKEFCLIQYLIIEKGSES